MLRFIMGLIYRLNFRTTFFLFCFQVSFFPNKLFSNPVKMYLEHDDMQCFMTCVEDILTYLEVKGFLLSVGPILRKENQGLCVKWDKNQYLSYSSIPGFKMRVQMENILFLLKPLTYPQF